MTEITVTAEEHSNCAYQGPDKLSRRLAKNNHLSLASHQEALRKATLLKHRKVSTQLKLDMVQRQLAGLPSSSSDRQFYRSQLSELSNELQDLGNTLERVERNAFYARTRLLKCYGVHGSLQLSASHPAIYSSTDSLDQSSKLKSKVHPLTSSPKMMFKKKHLMGELRAVASLSSLNVKSNSSCDDIPSKDSKAWKSPLRFLGHIMDNRICRKLLSKRIKSVEHLSEELPTSGSELSDTFSNDGPRKTTAVLSSTSSSSSTESSAESEEESHDFDACKTRRCVWKGPVERRVSKSQSHQQVDPALLEEIEDFEKMAAQYIKLHT